MSSEPFFPFESRARQVEAYRQGGWLFLVSEIMLFSGLFLAYTIGRLSHPQAFSQASGDLDLLLGTVNTGLLLTSSFTMALAVEYGHRQRARVVSWWLLVTALLGLAFVGIKGYEWWSEILRGDFPGPGFMAGGESVAGKGLFLWFYFTATGLHALHLSIGVVLMLAFCLWYRSRRPPLLDDYLVLLGLYWHLVDLVWIFLYPLLYQAGGHS